MKFFLSLIAALLFGVAVIFAVGAHWGTRYPDLKKSYRSPPLEVTRAPLEICHRIEKRLPVGVFSGPNPEFDRCLNVVGTNLYSLHQMFYFNGENIPVSILLADGDSSVETSIIEVIGGPGGDAILSFNAFSYILSPKKFFNNCNVAFITPSYSGTFHRSNFPNSSEDQAAEEISFLMGRLENFGVKNHLLAESLGARIVASPKIAIPSGENILFVPFLLSPEQGYENDLRSEKVKNELLYTERNFYVGKGSKKHIEFHSAMQFLYAFFSRKSGQFEKDFEKLWNEKENVKSNSHINVVLAQSDQRAGGAEYLPMLRRLNFTTEVVSGDHHANSEEEYNRRMTQVSRIFDKICPKNKMESERNLLGNGRSKF